MRAVLRSKGQITLPKDVQKALRIVEGDDIAFTVTEQGVLMTGLKSIRADQAWFWTEEWQAGERAANEQIETHSGTVYDDDEAFLDSLQ